MKLSIIVPVYNSENFIEKCVDSIMNTKENDFEILLINDGSTDSTPKILKKISKKYNNVLVYNNSNKGVSYSRNYGIKKAKGEYIMFVDADDELNKNWYENIKKYLFDYDIVYFSKNIIKDNIEVLLKSIIGCNNKDICIAGPYSKIFKREMILKNNLKFEEKIINGEDMLFNIECLKNSNSFMTVNFSFYLYRKYIGQSTKKYDERILNSDLLFHKKLKMLLKDFCIDIDERKKYMNFCLQNAIIMLYDRISFLDTYEIAKRQIDLLYKEPYSSTFKIKNSLINNKINLLFFSLYKKRKKKTLFYLFKLVRKVKYRRKKFKFVKI